MFDVDFQALAYRLLPSFMRKWMWAWVSVFLHGVRMVHDDLRGYRSSVRDQLIWGRAKLTVEALLRERFNETNIFLITQSVEDIEFLVSPASFNSRMPMVRPASDNGKAIVRPAGATLYLQQTQLVVQVPTAMQTEEDALKGYLRKYLHTGIIYEIAYQ